MLPLNCRRRTITLTWQYNASKAAVVQLAKSLAVEWVGHTRVNCISPGYVDTEIFDIHPPEWLEQWKSMIPARRFAQPYELKGVSISVSGGPG